MENKIININEFSIKKYVDYLRPEDPIIRKQLDVGYSYKNNIIILFMIRPNFLNPEEIMQLEFAKIRYYKSTKMWNLYWMRASGKWELYKPFPESTHLEQIINVIKKDELACFFG